MKIPDPAILMMRVGFSYEEARHLTAREINEYLEDGITSMVWLVNGVIERSFQGTGKAPPVPTRTSDGKIRISLDDGDPAELEALFSKLNRS